ncbi:MAG: hypothetical protein K1X81_07870 [Bacteroidia bacterium]|nr:hypothetical protein [Bacteroidia bacterium]
MNPIVKNILAVIAGVIIGGALNMGIIMISGSIIPPPEGVDLTTMEGLKASMPLMEPKHFLMPFLAHALGTFLGALIAALIVPAQKMKLAMIIGGWFLLGGIINILMLPSPLWFTFTDLIGAYFPMAYLGGKLMTKKES